MKRIVVLLVLITSYFTHKSEAQEGNKPKLVVGIVVDQMRFDYLTRFESKYGEGGFKRLIREGFNCKNNHYNYVPTYTGPGHASVYTGTTPKHHGIIANDWYDKEIDEMVYCAKDDSVMAVGTKSEKERMSPHRMKTTTFADENRLFTQMRGKTIGISVKDRGAVLPAGHTANAAYWFRGKKEGNFVSSTYYMKDLPKWVKAFNKSGKVKSYLREWNTLYDINTYTESGPDLNEFEGKFNGKKTATFPYDLKSLFLVNMGYDILKESPYGNSIVADFAIEALKQEDLGKDEDTDVLTVSFSSTDYVGHRFGVNSKEIEDTYIRLDKDLERLLKALDKQVGEGKYTVFLTADHGAVNVPNFLKSVRIPAGYVTYAETKKKLRGFLKNRFNAEGLIKNISNHQIFLDREKIKNLGLDLAEVQEALVNELITYEKVYKVFSATTMSTTSFDKGIEKTLQNGYNQKRSGDVLIIPDPGHIFYRATGTSHGTGFKYDTHVPLLFFGSGIQQGETLQKTTIPDIAPTISALLGTSFPNGATGEPLGFVLK
ncbi:alkaline phosphatase PafA [Seonamhaeicola marinus]|uniref:Alkaline phosphatase family protein n=1 Tax=Seonamhaeicola marinus TaxID=1912246 RepID=A0A5D0HHU3_9FLAO|nr:alkaline phosphatase PafA [Seonamhaeicola marinus]TYA69839.1 alkaline phosphatase family protein [Seonamhaeicola marinus]